METGLVHRVGDVAALTQQITMLHEDRALSGKAAGRVAGAVPEITWTAAGVKLLEVYRETIAVHSKDRSWKQIRSEKRFA